LDFGEIECDYIDWMTWVQGSDQTTGVSTVKDRGALYWGRQGT